MAVIPYEQRSFPGAAADTTLDSAVNATALTFQVASGTGSGFPDGSGGPFFVVIDYDTSSTEKVHCTARVGDVFTVDVRGADATTALAHAAGAKVRACWTATDAQEANRAAHSTLGAIVAKGDVLTGSGSKALVKTAVGADGTLLTADSTKAGGVDWKTGPAALVTAKGDVLTGSTASTLVKTAAGADNRILTADSSKAGGVDWKNTLVGVNVDQTSTVGSGTTVTGAQISAVITAMLGAWTPWTPVVLGGTSNPTITNRGSAYLLIGKTLHLRFAVTVTAIGSGAYTVTLPAGKTAAAQHVGYAQYSQLSGGAALFWLASGTGVSFVNPSNLVGVASSTVQANSQFDFTAVIEVA